MHFELKIISIILYFIVGIISLVMANKSLALKRFIPFHEEAAGTTLDKLDPKVQNVILSLMRTTGLGFLIIGILLVVFPIINYFKPEIIIGTGIPFICGIYCLGLFLTNYQLHTISGAETPWKGSLIAVIIVFCGIAISFL